MGMTNTTAAREAARKDDGKFGEQAKSEPGVTLTPGKPKKVVNKLGFPLAPCSRCTGSGRYSRNSAGDSTCYGCNGSGWMLAPGKTRKAYAAYLEAVTEARALKVSDIKIGDVVKIGAGNTIFPFATVTDIKPDRANEGRVIVHFDNNKSYGVTPDMNAQYKNPPGGLPDPADFTAGL